jgi:hypothetical protein
MSLPPLWPSDVFRRLRCWQQHRRDPWLAAFVRALRECVASVSSGCHFDGLGGAVGPLSEPPSSLPDNELFAFHSPGGRTKAIVRKFIWKGQQEGPNKPPILENRSKANRAPQT